MDDVENISIDYLMTCDGAQAVGGKLYILGGGWDQILVPTFPGQPPVPFALAVGVLVPWHLTNRRFQVSVELRDADGATLTRAQTELEAGRPPGVRPGITQRLPMVLGIHPEFPKPGRYSFIAAIDEEPQRQTAIEVMGPRPDA